jgi:uncharacterized membrane protein
MFRLNGECLTVSSAVRRVSRRHDRREAQPAPGVLFGLGLGGFVDGIVLHEILQWHHMISSAESSNTLSGLELNVVADGFFHVVMWLLVMAGSIMTLVSWRKGRLAPTWSFHFGLLLAGWGISNIIEGSIDHQLLGIHHVRDDLGGPLSWDIGFLLFCGMPSTISRWPLHWRRWPPSLCQASAGFSSSPWPGCASDTARPKPVSWCGPRAPRASRVSGRRWGFVRGG